MCGGGRRGEEREQLLTQADQEHNAFLKDESGGMRVTGGQAVLALLYQLQHTTDLWTLRLSNTTKRQAALTRAGYRT